MNRCRGRIRVPHVAHCAVTLEVRVGNLKPKYSTFTTFEELRVFIEALIKSRDFDYAQRVSDTYFHSRKSKDDPVIPANYNGALSDCRSMVRGMVAQAKEKNAA